jgi:hypothetical protein
VKLQGLPADAQAGVDIEERCRLAVGDRRRDEPVDPALRDQEGGIV